MTKVLIISYFFPPSSFVGGERTSAWSKHLYENGIYPIIVTRNWNNNQKDLVDKLDSNDFFIEKNDKYEIHKMPYKRSLRDRVSNYRWLNVFQKVLTLKEIIFSNFFIRSLPYYNIYQEAEKIIQNDPSIELIIASGRPFQSFFIGYRLKKKFPKVKWVPDYRDEWTTHKHLEESGKLNKWINQLERKSELKWTSNANFFISVSDSWVSSIQDLTKKPGVTILNGYSELTKDTQTISGHNSNLDELVITYAGTLYESQNIDLVIDSCLLLMKTENKIVFRFIGTNISVKRLGQIKTKLGNYKSNFLFFERMSKEELKKYIDSTDLLMLTGFNGIKGWYPVKLFEYYASGKPILLCPSDNDVMEDFIIKSKSGFVVNNEAECNEILNAFLQNKKEGKPINCERDFEYGNQFSRKAQTKKLAEIIHKL